MRRKRFLLRSYLAFLPPHARKFGSLVLLNPNGRLEPVNSYTSAILRKLYGADKLNSINSDQFFLNLLAFPDEWGGYPFIKVDNKDILQRFGRDGKYIAWQDVFDADGNYVLTDEVNAIYDKIRFRTETNGFGFVKTG